ncbi:MAG: DNA mismatch repair protein MutS [Deltaproteobacteria bacterium]|nr:DNA mismatch repair protein MutS [Deltaproteobacteria bacterium]
MNLTPAMRQYLEIKEQYKDCILFFRMGDFYEMFFEDAVVASKILEIALTSRSRDKQEGIPLCGVPYHAASAYISRLIDSGFKVAVCEQVEDPKLAKGIVRREVVRVVTPGLVVEPDNLIAKENNFLAGLSGVDNEYGLAFIDISTGEFWVTRCDDREMLCNEVAGHDFREIIVCDELRDSPFMKMLSSFLNGCLINYLSSGYFEPDSSTAYLDGWTGTDGSPLGDIRQSRAMASAAGAVIRYVRETQKESLSHLNEIHPYAVHNFLVIDETARRNLELFSTIQEGKKQGSLIHVIDQTVTAMGGRHLRRWLLYPLVDAEKIKERHAAVAEMKEHHQLRYDARNLLSRVYDMERVGGRIAMGIANARDLISLRESLSIIPGLKAALQECRTPLIRRLVSGLDAMEDVVDLIGRAIEDDPPVTIRDGSIIKRGFNEELDALVSMSTDGKRWIASLEDKERKRTGIHSLKVGFNNIFGYYIEVTKSNIPHVPGDYIRKQTLVNAERYINEELKEYESTVLNAEERRKKKEYELFLEVREGITGEIKRLQRTASSVADIDCLASLAEVAERYGYRCPEVTTADRIFIREGRHPVVERMDLDSGFVPNDAHLDGDGNRVLIITGPNMAGKSTYIRQVALIVIMAQMGGFVPANEAEIGIVDRVFTRVGAADSLSKGHSTFMVEMIEVAAILRNATPRSLILLDEVGRGTSTFDGLSIAWAVTEYIHDSERMGSRTLFATHYHELTELALTRSGIKNYCVAVKEWGDTVIFLRKIVSGGSNRSYGIQVARLAGVPGDIIARAREILKNLETGELDEVGMPKIARGRKPPRAARQAQLPLFLSEEEKVIGEIKATDVTTMTPIEALQKIGDWRSRIK